MNPYMKHPPANHGSTIAHGYITRCGICESKGIAKVDIAELAINHLNHLKLACHPILESLRLKEPFEEPGWNPDYHLEITVSVRDALALARAFRGESTHTKD